MNDALKAFVKKVWPYFAVSGGGFVLAYAIVGLFIFPSNGERSDLPVPNVTGLPFEQAKQILTDSGFVAQRGEQRYESTVPEGSVLNQSPAPQTVQSRGARVVLDISRGQRTVEVPPINGLTQQQAEATLTNSGLDIGDVIAEDSPSPRGTVLSSFPASGARVPAASAITITVSAGPSLVTVPDVTGQQYAAARSLLEQLGFIVGPAHDTAADAPNGTVIAQDPQPSQAVNSGSSVTLSVAFHP